jgi:predicted  nucleic acid-binding Zn-ribbon protein
MALQKRRTRMYEPWGYREENEYQSSAGRLGDDLEKFFARAEYNKNDKLIHFYNKDDEEKGTIDVTEFASSVIESVSYDTTTKILTIKFANGDVVNINIAELIDENEFGDGLVVEDGIVKVLIDPTSDPYLTVGADGVKLSGVESGFNEVNSSITNINSAITEIEGDVVNINSSITSINSAITNIEGDITEINSAITNIEGDIIEINSAITYIDSALTVVEGDIINISSAITNMEGDIYNINSAITVIQSGLTDDYYTKEEISEKEKVVSAALNDLNDRKFDDVSYASKKMKFFSTNEGVKTELNELDLSDLIDDIEIEIVDDFDYFDEVEYVKDDKKMYFKHNGEVKGEVDTTDFVIDGMLESVEIKDVEISGETVTCLVLTFNTDAGSKEIDIPISEIFDATKYYTKDEINAFLGTAFTASPVVSSVTDVIKENEEITAAALNDLNARKFDDVENVENVLKFYRTTNDGVKILLKEVSFESIVLDDYYTKEEVDELLDAEKEEREEADEEIIQELTNTEEVISAALNNLNNRVTDLNTTVTDFIGMFEIDGDGNIVFNAGSY